MNGQNGTVENLEGKEVSVWKKPGTWIKIGVLVALVVIIAVGIAVFDWGDRLVDLLEWLKDHKVEGFFIFGGMYVLATVFFIPGLILSLGAGYVFGLGVGILAVFCGATIGQTVAFLLGRFLMQEFFQKIVGRFKFWQAIELAIEEEGWKIVGLLRLAPVVPYNLLNYALGLTTVKFWHYFFSSAFGILPGTCLYVYFGSLAKNIQEVSDGNTVDSRTTIITGVVSGVVIIAVVVLTTMYAKRAIKKRINTEENGKEAGNPDEENQVARN